MIVSEDTKMINIAIIDDDIAFLEIIKKKLLTFDNSIHVTCYSRPYDAIDDIDRFNYILLDIDLPQIDGISLAKKLRKKNISIFFITSHEEFMIKAFGKNVEGFILKEELDQGINNFFKFMSYQKNENSIIISVLQKNVTLYFEEIIIIKYSLRDIEYHLINHKIIVQKNKNLKDIIINLNDDFIMINRNTVVNIQYVDKLKDGYVFLQKEKFKVSRRKLKDLKLKLFERNFNNDF